MNTEYVLGNLDKAMPYFHPVLSADEHRVAGYEVLGRIAEGNTVRSLGSFLLDETVQAEHRIKVDNLLLDKALSHAAGMEGDFLLFINRDPLLLMADHGEEFLKIVLKHFPGENASRIVLELTDSDYEGILDQLQHVLAYFKTYGIKIAIDHSGSESHLDRIVQISPHILKINLDQLQSSGGESAQVILSSLGYLARKIGASLLFNHIETSYQLRYAWKNGGRYYQGFLLARPEAGLADRDILRDKFRKECEGYIALEIKKYESAYNKIRQFNDGVKVFASKHPYKNGDYGAWLHNLAGKIENMCFRLYVCSREGIQLSPNCLKKDGEWHVLDQYQGKNWSWRPYFLENIVKMQYERKGILSDLYSDLETGETIRTFSYPLNSGDYLFIDLSYDYLYENDEFL